MVSFGDIQRYWKAFIPGWTLCNKYHKGADYSTRLLNQTTQPDYSTVVPRAGKYWPEIYEALRATNLILGILAHPLIAVYHATVWHPFISSAEIENQN